MSDKESIFKKTARLENAELIDLVRQRTCLWDRGCPKYRSREEKDKAWEEVYRELEPAFDAMSATERHTFGVAITRKWYNIRDCYKKFRNGTTRVNISGKPYIYAKYLTFLDSIYDSPEHTRKRKTYTFEEKESIEEPEEQDEQEEWLNEVFVEMDTAESVPGPTKKIKTEYPRTKEADVDDSIVSVLVNLIEKEEDEDRAFFKSITPTVKSLSNEDKFMFRIQVMKLLKALKKRERRHPSLKTERISQDSESE